jgi:hypothetical protein
LSFVKGLALAQKGEKNMSLNKADLKSLYYYTLCLISFFVLMWGAVDAASASAGLLNIRGTDAGYSVSGTEPPAMPEKGDQFFDAYYQSKMLTDRLWDSLARIIIAGSIFAYSRYTVNRLEQLA